MNEVLNKTYGTLYKQDSHGKIRIYFIEQQGSNYRMVTGVKDGALVRTKWTVASPKNTGRSNATSSQEQATIEIAARYTKKLSDHYHLKIEDAVTTRHSFFSPMLAVTAKVAKFKMIEGKPVILDPKLDGMRMSASSIEYLSRKGKPIPAAAWLYKSIKEFLDNNPNITLDGEIYNHEYRDDFQSLMKICRRTKLTDDDKIRAKDVLEFHIYDMKDSNNSGMTALERKRWLDNSDLESFNNIKIVDWEVADTVEDFDRITSKHLSDGYEGSIVRIIDSIYVNARSNSLIKIKEFMTEEFVVLDIVHGKGNRSDIAGSVTVNVDGMDVGCGIRGSWTFSEDLLKNRVSYLGGLATVRYFNKTDEGKLRFPVVIDINRPD